MPFGDVVSMPFSAVDVEHDSSYFRLIVAYIVERLQDEVSHAINQMNT